MEIKKWFKQFFCSHTKRTKFSIFIESHNNYFNITVCNNCKKILNADMMKEDYNATD